MWGGEGGSTDDHDDDFDDHNNNQQLNMGVPAKQQQPQQQPQQQRGNGGSSQPITKPTLAPTSSHPPKATAATATAAATAAAAAAAMEYEDNDDDANSYTSFGAGEGETEDDYDYYDDTGVAMGGGGNHAGKSIPLLFSLSMNLLSMHLMSLLMSMSLPYIDIYIFIPICHSQVGGPRWVERGEGEGPMEEATGIPCKVITTHPLDQHTSNTPC